MATKSRARSISEWKPRDGMISLCSLCCPLCERPSILHAVWIVRIPIEMHAWERPKALSSTSFNGLIEVKKFHTGKQSRIGRAVSVDVLQRASNHCSVAAFRAPFDVLHLWVGC